VHKFWALVFGVVIFLAVGLFAIAPAAGWWLPRNLSTFGGKVDDLFFLILAVTAFFFVLTEGILIYNIWVFGNPEPPRKAPYVHGNHRLEVVWTIVPAVILILIAVLQIGAWEEIKYSRSMPKPDGTVCQIVVAARQWEWRVRYPSSNEMRKWEKDAKGAETWAKQADFPYEDYPQIDDVHGVNEIHCWCQNDKEKSAKVLVHLKTRDVLHSFFLPHLRLKQDAVPGKVIPVWFELMKDEYNVEKKGGVWVERGGQAGGDHGSHGDASPYHWDLACAEFCGTRHSMMKGRLLVHKDKDDFLDWLKHAEEEQKSHTPQKPVVTAGR
jgi:cytochrome c oxidase subunit 2